MLPEVFVDTNVLIYHLIGKPPNLALKSKHLFDKADNGQLTLSVHPVVMQEAIHVLEDRFKVPTAKVVEILLPLTAHPHIVMDGIKPFIAQALMIMEAYNIDFTDALLGTFGKNGTPVATVNIKDFLRIPGCIAKYPDQF